MPVDAATIIAEWKGRVLDDLEARLNGTAPDRHLAIAEVTLLVGASRATVLRWEAEGKFPRRLDLRPHCLRWAESDVLAWKASREAVRPIRINEMEVMP